MRRMFSTRSASVKPRSRLRPWRTLSPSSRYVRTPRACSFDSTMLAIVDLPDTRQPGQPHHRRGGGSFCAGAGGLVDPDVLPVDVVRTAQREVQQAGTDRDVGQLVDDDEAAGVAVVGVRVERDRPVEADVAHADLVELERRRREMIEVVDVDPVLRVADRGADGAGADLHQVRPPGQHRVLVHPDDVGLELVGDLGGRRRRRRSRRRGWHRSRRRG